jgi:hypothetical protein
MAEVLFIVQKETHISDGKVCRFMYVQSCPHGQDIGAIELSDTTFDYNYNSIKHEVWEWHDLGNDRCSINPSLLVPGLHNGADCHFGPGEFNFLWLEPGQLRDPDTGMPSDKYMNAQE